MQARHAYVFYRSLAWKAKYIIRDDMQRMEIEDGKVKTPGGHEGSESI